MECRCRLKERSGRCAGHKTAVTEGQVQARCSRVTAGWWPLVGAASTGGSSYAHRRMVATRRSSKYRREQLCSPQDGGHLSTGGGAQQCGQGHAHERQHALQLLDDAREELIGCHTDDGGHQHDLECAQRQPLQSADITAWQSHSQTLHLSPCRQMWVLWAPIRPGMGSPPAPVECIQPCLAVTQSDSSSVAMPKTVGTYTTWNVLTASPSTKHGHLLSPIMQRCSFEYTAGHWESGGQPCTVPATASQVLVTLLGLSTMTRSSAC